MTFSTAPAHELSSQHVNPTGSELRVRSFLTLAVLQIASLCQRARTTARGLLMEEMEEKENASNALTMALERCFVRATRSNACHRASDSPYEIAAMRPIVKIARVRKSALPLPAYQSEHAAGIDLMADIGASIEMAPRERRAVPTGIAVEIPVGYEGQVRPRSGRALKEGLALINSPGTIDADYRGEVKVLLVNLGEQPIVIKPGDRIAQLIIAPVIRADIVEVDELAPSTRGPGGFGHTGR